MKKILLIIFLLIPSIVYALEDPKIVSKNAIIYDLTEDKTIYSLHAEEQVSIASLTKIMTTITAINNINNLDEEIVINEEMLNEVRWDASRAGLKNNDHVTYRDLLYASILPSGADATISLAISTTGSINNFVNKMNETAGDIGLKNTHFVNVTGLDEEGHYSTVNDVLTLLKYALNNPLFKQIYTTKEYTLSNGLHVKSTLYNYNKKLNKDTSRILGSKTGFTNEAGLCISALFNSNNHDMLLITIKAPNENGASIIDALTIIDYMDNNYKNITLSKKDTPIKSLKVLDSKIDEYNIYTKEDIIKYLPIDYDINKLKIEYNGLDNLNYKVKQDAEIGEILYYYDNELINKEKVYLNISIEKDYIKIIKHYKFYLLVIFIIIILCIIITNKILIKKKLGVK